MKSVDFRKNTGGEGGCLARVKLKGIDGGPHKRWSMWFNSMIREEPYQGLTYAGIRWRHCSPSGSAYRCCMAVVSSCCEV